MTAVNWLVEKLNQCEPWYSGTNVPVDYINQLIEQAREMEKKQIKDAIIHNQNGLLRRKTVLEAEEYYNQTYGK